MHSPSYEYADVFRTDAAGIPGQFVLEIVQNSGAYLAGWFREKLGDPVLEGRPDPELEAASAAVTPGCGGLVTLPYWNAVQSPFWNPIAHGAIVGLAGSYGRAELYRSVLEGLSIEMARNLAGLQQTTGVPLTRVTAVGGGQRSPLWRRIMTDAIGLPLTESPTEEVSAMGAAVMAMAATGAYESLRPPPRRWPSTVPPPNRIRPPTRSTGNWARSRRPVTMRWRTSSTVSMTSPDGIPCTEPWGCRWSRCAA